MQLPVTLNQMATQYSQDQYSQSNSPPYQTLPLHPTMSLASTDLPKPTRTRGQKRKSPPASDLQQSQHQHQPPGLSQVYPSVYTSPSDYDGKDQSGRSPDGSGGRASPGQTSGSGGRTLSTSKRAEQNRKAQRAFRERRDAHVRALESRSQMLDAAMASAEEANRRWEECRALCESLRVENAGLRAALSSVQQQQQNNNIHPSLMAPLHPPLPRLKVPDRDQSDSPRPQATPTRSHSVESSGSEGQSKS